MASGISASGLSSETPETERVSRDVWRPSNPTYHWNLALHCGRSRRMVYTSLSGGWDLYLHDWVLCLDEPGNPFPLLILSSRDMSKARREVRFEAAFIKPTRTIRGDHSATSWALYVGNREIMHNSTTRTLLDRRWMTKVWLTSRTS